MKHLPGFRALADAYDGFIVDLWGVVHDGVTPYEGAIDCLKRIKAMGKPSILLSNAPRRSHVAQAGMRRMGIADDFYTGILTSGEQTHTMLRDRTDPFFAAFGPRVFHLGPDRDRNVIEDLPFIVTDDPARADWALNTGPDDLAGYDDPEPYDATLAACLAAKLPMICANPDLEVIRGGQRVICAGLLTQRYEAWGGIARWIGKPDPAIYGPVTKMLGLERGRILAVGDALRTDIAGAAAAGIAACWVLGGIHGAELANDPALADRAAKDAGLAPDASVPAFIW